MRTVSFNKFIPIEYQNTETRGLIVPGTGCWEKDFPNQGKFHSWGSAYEEFREGPGNFTVAIVELPDGTISEVLPSNLKFID